LIGGFIFLINKMFHLKAKIESDIKI